MGKCQGLSHAKTHGHPCCEKHAISETKQAQAHASGPARWNQMQAAATFGTALLESLCVIEFIRARALAPRAASSRAPRNAPSRADWLRRAQCLVRLAPGARPAAGRASRRGLRVLVQRTRTILHVAKCRSGARRHEREPHVVIVPRRERRARLVAHGRSLRHCMAHPPLHGSWACHAFLVVRTRLRRIAQGAEIAILRIAAARLGGPRNTTTTLIR